MISNTYIVDCDCNCPTPINTIQGIVCGICGIVLDKIYESFISHQMIAHVNNPMIREIHPSINKTLTELSHLIDISTVTRMKIIQRVYQLMNPQINYILATKFAFQEMFPNIKIILDSNSQKKMKIIEENPIGFCPICSGTCAKSYQNNYLLNKIRKLRTIMKKGQKKNRKIDDILHNVNFSKTTYYTHRNIKYKHTAKKSIISKKSKITPKIHDYIKQHTNDKLIDIKYYIIYNYFIELNESTIWRHIQKIEKGEIYNEH